jgi:hypothetical protein
LILIGEIHVSFGTKLFLSCGGWQICTKLPLEHNIEKIAYAHRIDEESSCPSLKAFEFLTFVFKIWSETDSELIDALYEF